MQNSTPNNIVPGLAGSPAKAAEQIIRLLDESRAVSYMHTYEHFRRTLLIWQAALNHVKMGPWLETCAGMEKGLGPLQQALGMLMTEAMHNYYDVIGSVYMLLSQGEKRLGQYFTPYPVAKMMAERSLSDLKPRESGALPIRMLEPSCGSGVMILAMAEAIESRYPGMVMRGDVQFFGSDLDPLCVTMCNINMLLHGIGRLAKLDDGLSEAEHATIERASGRPLRFAFQCAKIVQGNALDPETDKAFLQENPWMPVTLMLPPAVEDQQADKADTNSPVSSQAKAEVQAVSDEMESVAVADRETTEAGLVASITTQRVQQAELTEPRVKVEENCAAEQPTQLFESDVLVSRTMESEQVVPHLPADLEIASTDAPKVVGALVQKEERNVALVRGNRRKQRNKAAAAFVQQELFSLPS